MVCFIRCILIIIVSAFVIRSNAQIVSASISEIQLFRDGPCNANNEGLFQTQFSFQLNVIVQDPGTTYGYHLIDGDNRKLGGQGGLSGNRENENRIVAVSYNSSIAPYRIVIVSPSVFHAIGSEIDPSQAAYSSHFFNPHLLNSDCPDIICKGGTTAGFLPDKVYLSSPQSQSSPIFINRGITLFNFSLSHSAEFYAGNSVTLTPGYDSGPIGTISSYGIEDCTVQSLLYECWDLNQNGQVDISEDINNDDVINADDCN